MAQIVVVDVQPMYHGSASGVASRIAQYLRGRKFKQVIWYFVADTFGIGDDSRESVQEYLLDAGVHPNRIAHIQFIPKDYGFLRGWMDNGVDEDLIKEALRVMKRHEVFDSRSLEEAWCSPELWEVVTTLSDNLFWPSFDVDILLRSRKWLAAGGGVNECLRELELFGESQGVAFERHLGLVY